MNGFISNHTCPLMQEPFGKVWRMHRSILSCTGILIFI